MADLPSLERKFNKGKISGQELLGALEQVIERYLEPKQRLEALQILIKHPEIFVSQENAFECFEHLVISDENEEIRFMALETLLKHFPAEKKLKGVVCPFLNVLQRLFLPCQTPKRPAYLTAF